jgi:hypothetical protein
MKWLLAIAAVLEASTGLALMIVPAFISRLLLGAGALGTGAAVGRIAGCALLSLGLACWPSRMSAGGALPAFLAMLTYNLLVTCYLIFLGIGGECVGVLLWPAAAIHGTLTLLLVREWFTIPDSTSRPRPASRGKQG